ncbi:nuclear transport factor 2 family protein [Deinococcus irradiatisoli]|uniref:Nuclear transport factor 2 family protein n=1 Tax=Deinococcus irradiatisoli TaxID=2202254 RepID=A0A2Z3JMV0_9DEIO|nr:nuclear transport factor 2 family protein [Deinococcus irradiatisoli]AWN22534.1 nuclear transport factor 2 family protein [Deinococcus irradiatisoli]
MVDPAPDWPDDAGFELQGLEALYALDAVLKLDEAWNAAYQARDPEALAPLLADDWSGFFPDGLMVGKAELLAGMLTNPPAQLAFERQAAQLYGDTAITRGGLSADGVAVQGFLRVYARRGGRWQAVAVQVVP